MQACKRLAGLASATLQLIETNNVWALNASKTFKDDILGQHKYFIDNYGDHLSDLAKRYGDFKAKVDALPRNKITKSGMADSYNSELKRMVSVIGSGGFSVKMGKSVGTILFNEFDFTVDGLKRLIMDGIVRTNKGVEYDAVGFSDLSRLNEEVGKPRKSRAEFPLKDIFSGDSLTEQDLEEMLSLFIENHKLFESGGYHMDRLYKFSGLQGSGGDFFETLMVNAHASMKVAAMNTLDSFTNVANWDALVKELKGYLYHEMTQSGYEPTVKQMDNLMDDILGQSLYDTELGKKYYKLVSETRSVYTKLKYTTGIVPGTVLGINAATVGYAQFLAKKSGLALSYKNPIIDFLMDNMNVLRSESKTKDLGIKMNDDIGGTWSDWLVDMVASPEKFHKLNALLKSGLQSIPDMIMDQNVKRLSIARTLHSLGITYKNADKILEELKSGARADFDIVRHVHAQAALEYKNFFGTSSVFALNRHRWSRNMMINCMQGYMLSRAGEVINALHRFSNDVGAGKLSTWKDFQKYINDPANIELKSFIYMPLITAKIGMYADTVLNKDDDTPAGTRIARYAFGLNDTFQSMTSNFFGRIIASLVEDWGAYIDYTDMNGENVSLYGGFKVASQSVLASIMSQLYREFKVWDTVITPMKNLKDGYSLQDALASSMTEFDNIMDGLGKFGLLPGLDTFDTKNVLQRDDFFGMMMMNINATNESLRTSAKLKNMSEIEKLLNPSDSEHPFMNFLLYAPVIKQFFKDNPSMSATMNSKMLYLLDTDPVLKNLYKGNFDKTILDSKTTDSLYKELTALDFSSARIDEGLKSKLAEYGLNDMKADAFIKLLGDKMGERNLLDTIAKWAPDQKKMGLAKIIAFAENQVPGSSRVVLSYMAKTEYEKLVQAYNMQVKGLDKYTAKSSYQLTPNEDLAIKQGIIGEYYPHMFAADKLSWYRLIETRLNQLDPKGFTISPELNKFVNSLGFLDLMAYNETRKADSSAQYIKNVYSLVGKYVTDPSQRIKLMIAANETIQNLPADHGVKNTVRLGTVLGNIDILDKVLKDKTFMSLNKDIVEKALNITFGTVAEIDVKGLKAAREEIGDAGTGGRGSKAYRQGLYSAGKRYTPGQYDKSNREAANALQDKIPSLIRNLPAGYSPSRSNNPGYNVEAKYNVPRPVQYKDYLEWEKAFNPTKAETEQLVTGYIRRTPTDVYDKQTVRSSYKTPVFKTIASVKIPKGKRLWKNPPYEANS